MIKIVLSRVNHLKTNKINLDYSTKYLVIDFNYALIMYKIYAKVWLLFTKNRSLPKTSITI